MVDHYETNVGPLNGAKVIARAWTDPEYLRRLLADGTRAVAELGFGGPEGHMIVAVPNTPTVHNVVVCTLCSCYPWPVLGPAAVLVQVIGVPLADGRPAADTARRDGARTATRDTLRVWDSSAEARYVVVPRAARRDRWPQRGGLARLVTRDSMIGVGRPRPPKTSMTAHSLSLDAELEGPASPPRDNGEIVFAAPWERRVFGLTVAACRSGVFDWETFRHD